MKKQFSSKQQAKPQPIKFGRQSGRSLGFDAYLQTLPANERAAIQAAERTYSKDLTDRLRNEERVFSESMFGYEDRPAGPHRAREDWALKLFADRGDWSWRPHRDRAMGYGDEAHFKTFRGVPPGPAEAYRGQVFARS